MHGEAVPHYHSDGGCAEEPGRPTTEPTERLGLRQYIGAAV